MVNCDGDNPKNRMLHICSMLAFKGFASKANRTLKVRRWFYTKSLSQEGCDAGAKVVNLSFGIWDIVAKEATMMDKNSTIASPVRTGVADGDMPRAKSARPGTFLGRTFLTPSQG